MNTKHVEIIFPIPLSTGHIVTVRNLPEKLSKEDADKLCNVIKALVVIGEQNN